MTDDKKPGSDPGYIKTDRRVSRQMEAPKDTQKTPSPEPESEPPPPAGGPGAKQETASPASQAPAAESGARSEPTAAASEDKQDPAAAPEPQTAEAAETTEASSEGERRTGHAEPSPEQPTSSGREEPQPQTLADVGVYGVLRFCVSLLVEQAWVALGIRALPGRETKENLPEAKVAIDALTGLVAQLQPDLDDSEKRELETTLANLRINFVRRVG